MTTKTLKHGIYPAVKTLILALVFGAFYMDSEIIFRAILGHMKNINGLPISYGSFQGWTSAWMLIIGGITGSAIGYLNEFNNSKYTFPGYQLRILLGIMLIYTVEFLSGLFLNKALDLNIWRYTDPLNVLNQITFLYLPIWFFFSVFAQWADDVLRSVMFGEEWPGDFFQAVASFFKFRP